MLDEQFKWYNTILDDRMPQAWRKASHPRNKDYKRVREVLRGIIGTALMTDMRVVLNLNALEHILDQRMDPASQLESRVAGYLMYKTALDSNVAPEFFRQSAIKRVWAIWAREIEQKIARDTSV